MLGQCKISQPIPERSLRDTLITRLWGYRNLKSGSQVGGRQVDTIIRYKNKKEYLCRYSFDTTG